MEKFHKAGMKLTRASVEEHRARLIKEYETYQAGVKYGTERPNGRQKLSRLHSNSVLLREFKQYREAGCNVLALMPSPKKIAEPTEQERADTDLIVSFLNDYATTRLPKCEVAENTRRAIIGINKEREAAGIKELITVKSLKTYVRMIEVYLDPFEVCVRRDGLARAKVKFGTVEGGMTAEFPGEVVVGDSWQFHIVTLACTREAYSKMTDEERQNVKRVRRWLTVLIDAATRVILGFSISKNPNETAALEALRLAFMDKTPFLKKGKLQGSTWPYSCPILFVANDNGSEFGRDPFGGALFAKGVRTLGGSLMNGAAGVSELRGLVERFFRTCDAKLASVAPGYTAGNPKALNDRKPHQEAALCDDELHDMFVAFTAEYHNRPHRGLNNRTPHNVWLELSEHPHFDLSQMPSPAQMREACGFEVNAKISRHGITYAGAHYSSKFIRDQKLAKVVDRVIDLENSVEIKVDPYDLGAVSLQTRDGYISVPCVDEKMRGKSLRLWRNEQEIARLRAKTEALEAEDARLEARSLKEKIAQMVAMHSEFGMGGYRQSEINRARLELGFGKGHHEVPYIGRDEYLDPLISGFEVGLDEEPVVTGGGSEADIEGDDELDDIFPPDGPSSMDRFRSIASARRKKQWGMK